MVESFTKDGLRVTPREVVHTSHPIYGYEIEFRDKRAVWAPEFWSFPAWAAGADLAFLEAASWNRPIRFRGGIGGHAPVLQTVEQARSARIHRTVFVHIGRATIRAIDAGQGSDIEFAEDGQVFDLP